MQPCAVPEKPRQFDALSGERFDALIVGGGITGAGTARDLALRGLRVALVDQADFAFGTSSRSTKLVHGGLRYLEQMDFGLVFESLRERHILHRIAPHLVRPQPLMIPLYRGASRSPALVRTGLWLYDLLAAFRNIGWHRMLSADEARRRQPVLDPDGLRAAALYWDCRMDDARLCLENVLAAREAGAVTVNYARIEGWEKHGGRLTGARVRDLETGRDQQITARVMVNATGPDLEHLQTLDGSRQGRIAPTRGSHILVPRISTGTEALYLSADQDDRLFFIIPWGELSLIGTTEVGVERVEADPQPSAAEIDYLLSESSHYLPQLQLQRKDVISAFAGLRPLLAHDRSSPSQASREHAIFTSPSGLLSIGGGKYTTYRAMAAELGDRVMAQLGRSRQAAPTDRVPLPGGTTGPFDRFIHRALATFAPKSPLPPAVLERLFNRYGARTPHLLQLLDDQPALAQPLVEGGPLLEVEVVYAARFEMARTADDILRRRTPLALEHAELETLRLRLDQLLQAFQ